MLRFETFLQDVIADYIADPELDLEADFSAPLGSELERVILIATTRRGLPAELVRYAFVVYLASAERSRVAEAMNDIQDWIDEEKRRDH